MRFAWFVLFVLVLVLVLVLALALVLVLEEAAGPTEEHPNANEKRLCLEGCSNIIDFCINLLFGELYSLLGGPVSFRGAYSFAGIYKILSPGR